MRRLSGMIAVYGAKVVYSDRGNACIVFSRYPGRLYAISDSLEMTETACLHEDYLLAKGNYIE